MIFYKLLYSLVLIVFFSNAIGQSRWMKIYYGGKDAVGINFINSYDKGFLLVGKHGSNYVNYNWLIKTNINGEILWDKTLGDPSTNIMISDMAYNETGELYLVGLTGYYNNNDYDPLIMKLNACGEKEWCRVFVTDGNNFSNSLVITPDGGIVIVLRYMSADLWIDRVCLAKFSANGDFLWKQCYNSPDTSVYNEDAYDLTSTTDGGYLITGVCDYVDPNPPHYWWLKPYYIKIDSLGYFEWETIVHNEISGLGGSAWNTVLNPDSNCYYSSISHYYHSPSADAAALLKMDLDGNVIDIYDLAPPNTYGKMVSVLFVTDTTLAASAVWGSEWNALPPKAVIIDTLGNILNHYALLENEWMAKAEKTYDDKLLFFTNLYDDNNEQFDAYLFKLNQNLEDDTIYTQPFNYDTLCPYPIASDTIVQDDCGLIVGMPEPIKPDSEEPDQLLIYPNPASDQIHVPCSMFHVPCSILIYDMYGRKMDEVLVPAGQQEMTIDVSSYSKGIYIVVLKSQEGIVGRRKFVVY